MGKDWKGDIVFSDNVAIFRGHVGDNKPHSHWASQLTIALDGGVELEASSGLLSSEAVYISSNTEHRLVSGLVCSIYFDPLYKPNIKALEKDAPDGWKSLSYVDLPQELGSISASTNLKTLLDSDSLNPFDDASSSDEKFQKVIQQIKAHLSDDKDIDRDSLAKIIHPS